MMLFFFTEKELSFERRRRDALQHTEPERSEEGGAVAVMRSEAKKRKISPSLFKRQVPYGACLLKLKKRKRFELQGGKKRKNLTKNVRPHLSYICHFL